MIEDDRNSRFSEVVLPHLPDALTTALWLTGDRTDAEDVVQETCLRAFRLIANFTSGNARDRDGVCPNPAREKTHGYQGKQFASPILFKR
jgi:hypothetical protein